MEVTIVLPVYKMKRIVFKLLDSLLLQSYSKFNVMVIYKRWDRHKEILDKIETYKKLSISLVKQDEGFFEEALNTAYRKVDSEVAINTDDDAHVSKNWIKDHVELHVKHANVGMATGIVEESTFPDDRLLPAFAKFVNEQKWRMNKHTILDRPIDSKFDDYGMYIGKSGMLVDTGRKHDMIKTFKQHGVNMSWKRDALNGFRLPGYTKQGGRNEAAAALEVLNRGFVPVWFSRGRTFHPLQSSDSRGASIKLLPRELTAESVLFSYYVDMFSGYKVDLDLLKRRVSMDILVSRLISPQASDGYRVGYDLTKRAITQRWDPKKVRAELTEALKKVAR